MPRGRAHVRTTWGKGIRGKGTRRTAATGGTRWEFDPFAIVSWALPRNRRGRRRTIRRRR